MEGVDVYKRLRGKGIEVPDFALSEVLEAFQGQNRLKIISQKRRSEAEIRKHGGMLITEVDTSFCERR